jgi:hypothetical protein
MSNVISKHDQQWLADHARRAESEAFAALDRFARTIAQAALLKTILSSALNRRAPDGGNCRMALRLPVLVHSGIRGAPDETVYQLSAALTLLEAGIYTLDHIVDRELDGPLLELPQGAVLLGAVCLLSHLPNQVLLALPCEPGLTSSLARMLADGLAQIGAGQLEDITACAAGAPSIQAVERAVTLKTGERRALFTAMAARLASGTPDQVEAYTEFGRALGIARQLRSDLADLFGTRPSRDLASQVLTLPLVLYLEGSDTARTADMRRLLASAPDKNPAVQRQVCDQLRDSGVLRAVVQRIEQQCALALRRLEQAQPVQRAALLLRDLVRSASVVGLP